MLFPFDRLWASGTYIAVVNPLWNITSDYRHDFHLHLVWLDSNWNSSTPTEVQIREALSSRALMHQSDIDLAVFDVGPVRPTTTPAPHASVTASTSSSPYQSMLQDLSRNVSRRGGIPLAHFPSTTPVSLSTRAGGGGVIPVPLLAPGAMATYSQVLGHLSAPVLPPISTIFNSTQPSQHQQIPATPVPPEPVRYFLYPPPGGRSPGDSLYWDRSSQVIPTNTGHRLPPTGVASCASASGTGLVSAHGVTRPGYSRAGRVGVSVPYTRREPQGASPRSPATPQPPPSPTSGQPGRRASRQRLLPVNSPDSFPGISALVTSPV